MLEQSAEGGRIRIQVGPPLFRIRHVSFLFYSNEVEEFLDGNEVVGLAVFRRVCRGWQNTHLGALFFFCVDLLTCTGPVASFLSTSDAPVVPDGLGS